MYIVCASDFYSFTADFVVYVCIMCVCVIPLKFCILLFHARQNLMPQPILIAPRGPHRFIPSGEGASPSPFGPLNARGCVHEPPMASPPAVTSKTKNKCVSGPAFCRVRIIIGKTFRPYAPYIYTCHRL